MPTTTDVTDLMKPAFDTVRTGQEMWFETMRIWTELSQRSWSVFLARTGDGDLPSSVEMIDISFEHARRVLDAQEAYVKTMVGDAKTRPTSERKTAASTAQSSRSTAERTAA
ncbi:MAG: hypothetical protein ACREA0_11395 [bacterium]